MARTIAVMTGTRADFGLLRPLLTELRDSPDADLRIIATGSHLSAAHGMTVSEVRAAGFEPAAEIPIWGDDDSSVAAATDTGEAVAAFARALADMNPDVVVVLGDRLEAFAMATAAAILLIPVAHIHGGEITAGAMDDALRHSITKLSYLHFTTTDDHRNRVIRLGEAPDRVFNFGAPVLDSLVSLPLLDRPDISDRFGIRFAEHNMMMTFHPAAFDVASAQVMIDELLAAMGDLADEGVHLIITGTNNDIGSSEVRAAIAAFVAARPDQVDYVESFGQLGYLSTMKQMSVVTGNSSSTVLEAPVLGIPAVLVGNRQEGRPMSAGVLHPAVTRSEIRDALTRALTPEFRAAAATAGTPFGQPGFARKAAAELITHDIPTPPKKQFWQEST
ncbi:UDP-N-acetylglucosamine 2-epimerase (non-hydrolysing) [Microbacteriaceae bacterium MWH-Ta3]|nr:UDP-N-acetylglucosamine 2-epimerase (non-hydrolysing) [Microbacteriaceae bacterium MWH-Ta3]